MLHSNSAFDGLLNQALSEFDETHRNQPFADATRLAVRDDVGLIPLYWQRHVWGTKADLRYEANVQSDNAVRFIRVQQ